MSKVVEHIKQAIHFGNTASLVPVFDTERPIRRALRELAVGWLQGRDRVEALTARSAELQSTRAPDRVVAALTGEAQKAST